MLRTTFEEEGVLYFEYRIRSYSPNLWSTHVSNVEMVTIGGGLDDGGEAACDEVSWDPGYINIVLIPHC